MSYAIAWLLVALLVVFLSAHAAMLVTLALRSPRHRALVALVVPPLAPYWTWRAGRRALPVAWLVALALYAVGVGLLAR